MNWCLQSGKTYPERNIPVSSSGMSSAETISYMQTSQSNHWQPLYTTSFPVLVNDDTQRSAIFSEPLRTTHRLGSEEGWMTMLRMLAVLR